MIKEASKEAIEEWDEDPEWHIERGHENPHEVHPWGDTVNSIRAWINQDDFVFYCVFENLKEHGQCMVEDYLIEMADGVDNGRDLQDSIERHYNSLMQKFQRSVAK